MSLKIGSPQTVSFQCFSARWRGEALPSGSVCWFGILAIYRRGGGKVGNPLLVFHFSIRLRRRRCGNVGISPALGEISKVLVERGESLHLAFHAFLSTVISTALLFRRHFRQRASSATLAFCIRRAASVSLLALAWVCSNSAVIPSFRLFSHSGSDRSFSYGVR